MNKNEFLKRLNQGLDLLDDVEKREIIGFYEERFHSGTVYEGKTEEQVVADLETPETIAKNVLEEYGINPKYIKTKEERYTNIESGQVVGVALFDVFIASWLIPAIVSITFALFATLVSYVAVVPLLFNNPTIADKYMFALLTAGYILLFFVAMAILDLSIFIVKKIIIWHINAFKLKNREKWIKRMSRLSIERLFRMNGTKRFLRSILIIGSIVTIAYSGFQLFIGDNQYFSSYNSADVQTDEYSVAIDDVDAWTINTDLNMVEVIIKSVDREDIYITHTYIDKQEFEMSVNTDTNNVSLTQEIDILEFPNFQDIISLFLDQNQLIIEVPLDLDIDSMDIALMNGQIDIQSVDMDTINIDLSNGRIVLNDMEFTGDVNVKTLNGLIDINNVTSQTNLDVQTSNGRIVIKNSHFIEYNIETSNGEVILRNLNTTLKDGELINVRTSNGSIELDNVYALDVSLKTSNGSIDYNNDDLSYVLDRLHTTIINGSYDGNVVYKSS